MAVLNFMAENNLIKEKQKLYGFNYFDGGAANYSLYNWQIYALYMKPIALAISKVFRPKCVLDIGCAKGFLVKAFQKIGIEAFGVDISKYAISNSPSLIRDRLYILDIETQPQPFPDNYFDLACAIEVFEHLKEFNFVLKEIARVLKSGGYVILATPTRKIKKDQDITHINIHNKNFWIKLMKKNKFILDTQLTHQLNKEIAKQFRQKRELFYRTVNDQLKNKPPNSWVAKFLTKLGGSKICKLIRIWLAYYYYVRGGKNHVNLVFEKNNFL